MKKLTLLALLLAGCEGCVGTLPRMSIPDTRPISEFTMTYEVRAFIGAMYDSARAEGMERAACLWASYELTDTELPNYKSDSYYQVGFDSIAPAHTTKATFNTVGIADGGPCDEGAVATVHTHLLPGPPSSSDLIVFLGTRQHVATFVVDGVGLTEDGKRVARLLYVMRHGLTGTWVIPLYEEEP